eukprot:gb/GEZN01001785.1/.p1 GENE.gb/GEZN01001785.1/~~gb/GEZN01001785.1/.p1  ORF type:complete len:850 (-),score=114.96 gb/GEZN01001785.1/:280-2772(-)
MSQIGSFKLGPILGSGASGTVRLGTHVKSKVTVALKIIKKKQLQQSPELEDQVRREIAILKVIDHPNVLQLYDVIETHSKLYLVLEHVSGGELFDYLLQRGKLPAQEVLRICAEIVQGLEHCHDHGICHRDLKPENLLLTETNAIKIADFGLAHLMKPGQKLDTACGSPHYISPEIVDGKEYDGKKADVWSLGVILFALTAGYLPFDHDNTSQLLELVSAGTYTMAPVIAPPIADLIQMCLQVDVNKRISMSDIKSHSCFKAGDYFDPSIVSPIQEVWKLLQAGEEALPAQADLDPEIILDLVTLGLGSEEQLSSSLSAPVPKTGMLESHMPQILYVLLAARKSDRAQSAAITGEVGDPQVEKKQVPVSSNGSVVSSSPSGATKSGMKHDLSHGSLKSMGMERAFSRDEKGGTPSISRENTDQIIRPAMSYQSFSDRIDQHMKLEEERHNIRSLGDARDRSGTAGTPSRRLRGATDVSSRHGGVLSGINKMQDRGRLNTWGPGNDQTQRSKGPALFFLEMGLTLCLKSERCLALLKTFLKEVIGDSSSVLGWMGPKLFTTLKVERYYAMKMKTMWGHFQHVPTEITLPEVTEQLGQDLAVISRYSSLKKRTMFDISQFKFTPAQESFRQLVTMTTFSPFLSSQYGTMLLKEAKGTELSTVIKQCAGATMMQKKLRTGRKKWLINLIQAVENLPVCVALVDMLEEDFPYLYANEEFEHISGYTRDDVIGRKFSFMQGAETSSESKAFVESSMREGKTIQLCMVNYRRKGEKFCNFMELRPIHLENKPSSNRKLRYYAICQMDVTDSLARNQMLPELYYMDSVFNLLPRSVQ